MARRTGKLSNPPTDWVDLLEEHDDRIVRVRVLWRRGGGDYRPLSPSGTGSEGAWNPDELSDTHFEWASATGESPADTRERIAEVVADLWDVASRWTRAQGGWCDFKLVAFDRDKTIIFEDGKRCQTSSRANGSADSEAEAEVRSGRFDDYEEDRSFRRDLDRRVESLIDTAFAERDKSYSTAQETLGVAQRTFVALQESMMSVQRAIDTVPGMMTQASDMMKDSVQYQEEQNRRNRAQADAKQKMQYEAIKQMEQSRRFGMGVELLKESFEAAMANIVPIVQRVAENGGRARVRDYPEFEYAQQAMAYLVITLTPTQLRMIFGKRDEARKCFMAVLDEAAQMDNEQAALEHMASIVKLLRSETFRDVADPEQQQAVRRIISRLALYRIVEFGEGDDE